MGQQQLADAIGVTRVRINEIMLGKRAITPDTAFRLFVVLLSNCLLLFVGSCSGSGYNDRAETQFSKFLSDPKIRSQFDEFELFLKKNNVDGIIPAEQLLRQGTDWQKISKPPYAMPPKSLWPNMVPTLKVIRDIIIPAVGKVEVVSGYRTSGYNAAARGAGDSQHLVFSAVDLIPGQGIAKKELHKILKAMWKEFGKKHSIGLGLYSGVRFHIDTAGYRTW